MGQKLVLIDGHNIIFRAFYGVPDLTNSQGMHTNAIYGFLNIMFKILDEEKPDYLVVAFDAAKKTFRHEMYAEYKGTRKAMPDELREQVPMMQQLLKAMGVVTMECPGIEADDILGTLAKKAQADGMEVSLVSGDRDLLQIADEHIKIRIPKTKMGRTEIEDYYPADVERTYQVTPKQFIDLKALMGDTADNIPGVPKIGPKTATELMVTYGSVESIYEHLEEIAKKSVVNTLRENKELAELSKVLATIRTDCEIELDYEAARAGDYFTEEAYPIMKQLELKSYIARFDQKKPQGVSGLAKSFRVLSDGAECAERLNQLDGTNRIGIYPFVQGKQLYGLAVSVDEENTFVYISESEELDGFVGMLLENALQSYSARGRLAAFDIKKLYSLINKESTERYFDVLIGAYLLNPLKSDYDLEAIASEHLSMMIPGEKELLGKRTFRDMMTEDRSKLTEYACTCAYVVRKAADVLEVKLKESGMATLMNEVEMPLSLVLCDMEREGVCVRREELKAYGDALVSRITELEQEIHEAAGRSFNILSPKQLGEVLFEELKLPGGKKTKTGYSTAADVLEKLAGEYKIVRDILEYRGLTKLKSTYADGLANYIEEDGRIHTNFNQTITATGRISSTEPNLQNIPMRMELGRRIRKVFVPKEGCVFIDADYSQIELRILAHMSGDEQLIEAYRMDEDIHRITASKVFHTPFEEVTDLQRRNAKAVNFGIVYGISSFGLSQDLSISPKEAAQYIEQYFETYPKVKEFLNELVASTREKGYSTTLYGRRRPVPEISSSNFMQRSFGERIAMNSPIQGTAADIMKIAMIMVWKALRDGGYASKLILQVHDELLIEAPLEEEERVTQLLVDCMKGAADLAVSLEVDAHSGSNWFEAK